MKKPLAILIALCAGCLGLIAVFHELHLPLYEWTWPLIALPIMYAGVNFRRAGSFSVFYILAIGQSSFIIDDYSVNAAWGFSYLTATIASGVAGIYLGHFLRSQKNGILALDQTQTAIESIGRGLGEDAVLDELISKFSEYGSSERVSVWLFDDGGALRRRGAEDEPPLAENHLYNKTAVSGEFFVSVAPAKDPRISIAPGGGAPAHLAVFPLAWSGQPRGVIVIEDTVDEYFGGEAVSFLTTLKQAFENTLEIVNKQRIAVEHEMRRERIRDTFSSYMSRRVAEEILKDPDRLDLGGSHSHVAVLFTEIAGFAELIDTADTEELTGMLNEFFSIAIDTVFDHDGTLDKFIGDNVMAFWGAPLAMPDCEEKAVRCAVELRRRAAEMNVRRRAAGRPEFDLRIGINSGRVVAGNIGSIRRMEYTIIGDTVNTAARIKSLTGAVGAAILVSDSVYEKVRGRFPAAERIQTRVKGKSQEIVVYGVGD